jgi:hypothetical protein
MNPEPSSKFTLSNCENCHHFCKTLSEQKHVVLQPTAPFQLKRLKLGSKMGIAASALVAEPEKIVAKSPNSLTHPLHIYNPCGSGY